MLKLGKWKELSIILSHFINNKNETIKKILFSQLVVKSVILALKSRTSLLSKCAMHYMILTISP